MALTEAATYPSMVQRRDEYEAGWISIHRQDAAVSDGNFPWIRRVLAAPFMAGLYNLTITLWQKPPREYPPQHAGDRSLGQNLNPTEARALRDALTAWLKTQSQEDDDGVDIAGQFPEHEKMKAIENDADVIAAFLEWCQEQGISLVRWDGESLEPIIAFGGIEKTLAAYFEIDLEAIRLEKAQMLGVMRAQNDGYDPKHQYQPEEIVPTLAQGVAAGLHDQPHP